MPGGNIVHFGGIRIRVVGTGNLFLTLYGLDDILTNELSPIIMSSTDKNERTKLANLVSARGRLKLQTKELDEEFKVNNITIFVKPMWQSLSVW